jgi:hypothetical protein
MESLAAKHQKELPFEVKKAALKEGAPITHISEIQCEFYNYDEKAAETLGDVISVKFDDQDSYIGATYTSGILRVYNSFSGKVMQTLNFNPGHAGDRPLVLANSFKFRRATGAEREILLIVNT